MSAASGPKLPLVFPSFQAKVDRPLRQLWAVDHSLNPGTQRHTKQQTLACSPNMGGYGIPILQFLWDTNHFFT